MTETKTWYERFYEGAPPPLSPWYAAMLEWLDQHPDVAGSILELGCGRGDLLVELHQRGRFTPSQLFGLEQSQTAISRASSILPHLMSGNIEEKLPFEDGSMSVVVLAEVIEHLRVPDLVLREIRRVLRPDGTLLLSFPNYLNLPWLAVRLLAQWLNKPGWIVLQPIDHIFFYPSLMRRLQGAGFLRSETIGTVYLPPLLYRRETAAMRAAFDHLRLGALSFHPVLALSPISHGC